jgi:hypothetical protein
MVTTYSDSNFYDYIKLENFTKKTGIELDDFHSFAVKEPVDNGIDFVEEYYKGAFPTIKIYITNNRKTGFSIRVINPNDNNIDVFSPSDLTNTYNYKGAFSTKNNQFRVTRSAQGVALKQLGTLPYMQYNSKNWNHPIIFRHNSREDKVSITIDRQHGQIVPTFEYGNGSNNNNNNNGNKDTEIVFRLPVPMDKGRYKKLIEYCKTYSLFNTHIGFEFRFGINDDDDSDVLVMRLPAEHPISMDYKNPNSIYCYNRDGFFDFLNDVAAADHNATFYKAVAGFREIKQKDSRFEYLKSMYLKDELTPKTSNMLYDKLRASMVAMSKIPDPYDAAIVSRKNALIYRYLRIKPPNLNVDTERAVYVRTKDSKTKGDLIHKDDMDGIRFPYRFEVLAIPIMKNNKKEDDDDGIRKSIIISGVNYSTSINNYSYFTSDHYVYRWHHRKTNDYLQAYDIRSIVKMSMAGHDLEYHQNVSSKKLKQECILICHLIAPKIGYSNGYGKSSLVLEPFAKAIAETIEEAILKMPNKSKYTNLSIADSKKIPKIPELVYQVLAERWNKVQSNPYILEPNSIHYDPWSQSTVWYVLRDEILLPLEAKWNISIIRKGTRKAVTKMIEDTCQKLPGSPKREQLGIFASPRATMYFNGAWHDVDIKNIPNLAGNGTVVLFVEKRGVGDQLRHLADMYGIAIVNTIGHFTEYAKDLIPAIIKEDGYVAILTDFDCAGVNIAEKVIEEIIEVFGWNGWETVVSKRVKRLGLFLEDLTEYFNIPRTMVEEPYPKKLEKDERQEPDTNVINPIIEYAANYRAYSENTNCGLVQKYKRCEYIYKNFKYLIGIDPDEIITDEYFTYKYEKDETALRMVIDDALAARDPTAARRIELDNVIKVVGANKFGDEYVMQKLVEFFPEWNYNRATLKTPQEYIGERFHILPQSTKDYFLKVCEKADEVAAPIEKEITSELESFPVGDKGLLDIDVEKAVNERLLSEAVATNPEIQKLDKKHAHSLLDWNNGNNG